MQKPAPMSPCNEELKINNGSMCGCLICERSNEEKTNVYK